MKLWWKEKHHWQGGEIFEGKRVFFEETIFDSHEQTDDYLSAVQATKRQDVLSADQINKMKERSFEGVRKEAYSQGVNGQRLLYTGALGGGAAGVGAIAAAETFGIGKSVANSRNFQKMFDQLNEKTMSLRETVLANLESKLGFLGQKAVELLDTLKSRLRSITLALSEAKDTLKNMQEAKAKLKEIRALPSFWSKVRHPKRLVGNALGNVKEGINEIGDKYLRIPSHNGEFGIGRLERVIEVLESMKGKTEDKITSVEDNLRGELDSPKKAIAHIAETLGLNEDTTRRLISDHLNGKNDEILDLIENSSIPEWHKEELKNVINDTLKSSLHKNSTAVNMMNVNAKHESQMKAIDEMGQNEKVAKKIREMMRMNKLFPGYRINIAFTPELRQSGVDTSIRNGSAFVTEVNPGNGILKIKKNNEYLVFNVKEGSFYREGNEENSIALKYLKNISVVGGVRQQEQKSERKEKDTEALQKDKDKLIGIFDSNNGNPESLEGMLDDIKKFNTQHAGAEWINRNIEGKILERHERSGNMVLLFIQTESGVICDIAQRDKITEKKLNDRWEKKAGFTTSYEDMQSDKILSENSKSEGTPEIRSEDMSEIIIAFESVEDSDLRSVEPKIKEFNKRSFDEEEVIQNLSGEIIRTHTSDVVNDNSLVFFKTNDGRIYCDIAIGEDISNKKKGDIWKKPDGYPFSYESYLAS